MALSRRAQFTGAVLGGIGVATALASPGYAQQEAQPVQYETTQPVQYDASESPLVQASQYGSADRNNIGIMVYYGPGNGITQDQAGEYVVQRLEAAAKQRGLDIDAEYFVSRTQGEGISVGYHMGNTSVDAQDIRIAVADDSLDAAIDKRVTTGRLLARADFDGPSGAN